MCYSGMAASEGVHVLKVHASLIEIHIQVTNQHVMGHSLVSYVPIHVIMLVICRVEMHQDTALTPVSDCVVYYYPE